MTATGLGLALHDGLQSDIDDETKCWQPNVELTCRYEAQYDSGQVERPVRRRIPVSATCTHSISHLNVIRKVAAHHCRYFGADPGYAFPSSVCLQELARPEVCGCRSG